MAWEFRTSIEFPETAEYMEKLNMEQVGDTVGYEGSVLFHFRTHTNERGFSYPIPGVRTNRMSSYMIETNSGEPFKAGDIIKFNSDDRLRFKITNVSERIDKKDEEAYIYKTMNWKGLAKTQTRTKIITLE